MEGPNGHRVAEIIVTVRDGARRGSGYLIRDTAVLTAAHVVAEAVSVIVRFDADQPDEWSAPGIVAWHDTLADIAVLRIEPPRAVAVSAALFGRVGERSAVLPIQAVGFPRWKLRPHPGGGVYRDSCHLVGTVAVLSNRRSGTLEIATVPPESDSDPLASPWEAMSGAAVWAGRRIIGVVQAHHRREGLGRLTAVRLDRPLSAGSGVRTELAAALGLAVDAELPDVLPRPSESIGRYGYLDQVRDIAPADRLRDRDEELGELTRFCAGDEPYVWWQAGPWAGKSALMSTFVLDPPAGVDVIAFFVTARLTAQSDSSAFVDALLDQLAALVGEPLPNLPTAAARAVHYRGLLRAALNRCREEGRRLVLVVDGLDEDRGTAAGSGLPSIASLLPRLPDDHLRVIVSGRPDPPIPDDVPDDHPLRQLTVHNGLRQLRPSAYARETQRLAWLELRTVLGGDPLGRTILALIAACGGGLTLDDVQALTDLPRFEVADRLSGVLGRTVGQRPRPGAIDAGGVSSTVYLMAHETLRTEAVTRLGSELAAYRERVHAWADRYREQRWPPGTPDYLLHAYARLLQEDGEADRLAMLATDPARHERLLDTTGGDGAALAELRGAHQLLMARPVRNLSLMLRVAFHRDRLTDRNAHTPVDLPSLWARLGQPMRAQALAQSIGDPARRAEALTLLLRTLSPSDRDASLATLTEAAHNAVERISDPPARIEARIGLAAAVAAAGDCAGAVAMGLSMKRAHLQARALAEVAGTLPAGHGERTALIEGAAAITRIVDDPYWRSSALASLIRTAGGGPLAAQFSETARSAAHAIEHPYWRAMALAAIGQYAPGYWRVEALAEGARAAAEVWDGPRRSGACLSVASAWLGMRPFPRASIEALMRIPGGLAGEPLRPATPPDATEIAHLVYRTSMPFAENLVPDERTFVGVALVLALAAEPAPEWLATAVEAVEAISDPDLRMRTHAAVAILTGQGRRWVDATERLIRSLPDKEARSYGLTALAVEVAGVDAGRAAALARDAEALSHTVTDASRRVEVLQLVARALAGAGHAEPAGRLLREALAITEATGDAEQREAALSAISLAALHTSDFAMALETAGKVSDSAARDRILTEIVRSSGQCDVGYEAGRRIGDPETRLTAMKIVSRRADAIQDPPTALRFLDRVLPEVARDTPAAAPWLMNAGAVIAFQTGDQRLARAYVEQAADEAVAHEASYSQPELLSVLATTAARSGDTHWAAPIGERVLGAMVSGTPASDLETHTRAAVKLFRLGRLDSALAMLRRSYEGRESIDDLSEYRLSQWQDAAKQAAKAGLLNLAVIAAEAIAPLSRMLALIALGQAAAEADDRSTGAALLTRSLKAAEASLAPSRRDQALSAVAQAAATVMELDTAMAAVAAVADPIEQAAAFRTLMVTMTDKREFGRLIDLLKTPLAARLDDTPLGQDLIIAISNVMLSLEDTPSLEAVEHLGRWAQAMVDSDLRKSTLENLALTEAAAAAREGDYRRVLESAAAAGGRQVNALTGAALAASRREDRQDCFDLLNRAASIAGEAADPHTRTQALTEVAEAVREVGGPALLSELLDRALAATSGVSDPQSRARLALTLAQTADRAGDFGRSAEILDRLLDAAEDITDSESLPQLLRDAAEIGRTAHTFERAIAVAAALADPAERDRCRMFIATYAARERLPAVACAALSAIRAPEQWNQGLNLCIRRLDGPAGRLLVEDLLVTVRWDQLLYAVVRIAPGSLLELHEDLLVLNGSGVAW